METLIIGVVIFLSSFLQGMFGFAFVLFSMPLLLLFLSIKFVAPLIALFLPSVTGLLVVKFRLRFSYREVAPLIIGTLIGIPIGIYLLNEFSDRMMKSILGIFLVSYALYSLKVKGVSWRLPSWTAYLFGLLSGILGGAYNTTGPPAAMYIANREWPKLDVVSSMNFFIFTTSIMVLLFHLISGNITAEIFMRFLTLIPVMVLGMLAGIYGNRKLSDERYRKGLFILLIIMGIMLIG
ncbi:MAG TPA: sulfite exporter TauE/SafE family protein [Nitrospirae bacterium]|nr:sulfite exporter TauE/SafE family protein [Nitrospirota bacterium]